MKIEVTVNGQPASRSVRDAVLKKAMDYIDTPEPDSFAAGLERKESEEERDERVERESRAEALAEWKAMKAKPYQYNDDPDDECPHDELDHGICIECGRDCMDDLVDRAEMLYDSEREK